MVQPVHARAIQFLIGATVAALYEGVNELPGQGVPLLEQEGWLRQ